MAVGALVDGTVAPGVPVGNAWEVGVDDGVGAAGVGQNETSVGVGLGPAAGVLVGEGVSFPPVPQPAKITIVSRTAPQRLMSLPCMRTAAKNINPTYPPAGRTEACQA